jgi:uncharacterized protein (TIGR02285 family)
MKKRILLLLLVSSTLWAHSQEIRWAAAKWAPISDSEDGKTGLVDSILDQILERNPELQIQKFNSDYIKTTMLLKGGKNICSHLYLKTKERADYAYFTSYTLMPPLRVVVKASNAYAFLGKNSDVDLSALMNSSHWRGIFSKERSYGPPVDELLIGRSESASLRFLEAEDRWKAGLRLVAAGRVDYTVDYRLIVVEFNRELKDSDRLMALPIRGFFTPIENYIACTKNEWGRAMIEKFDKDIRALVQTKKYRSAVEALFLPDYIEKNREVFDLYYQRRAQTNFLSP